MELKSNKHSQESSFAQNAMYHDKKTKTVAVPVENDSLNMSWHVRCEKGFAVWECCKGLQTSAFQHPFVCPFLRIFHAFLHSTWKNVDLSLKFIKGVQSAIVQLLHRGGRGSWPLIKDLQRSSKLEHSRNGNHFSGAWKTVGNGWVGLDGLLGLS